MMANPFDVRGGRREHLRVYVELEGRHGWNEIATKKTEYKYAVCEISKSGPRTYWQTPH